MERLMISCPRTDNEMCLMLKSSTETKGDYRYLSVLDLGPGSDGIIFSDSF